MKTSKGQFSIRFLGPVEVECNGRRLETNLPQKGLALLAYLASCPGSAQPRRKLADLFWPDVTEDAARNNLRQALSGLKRQLGQPDVSNFCLVSDRQFIRFETRPDYLIDIASFLHPLPECLQVPGNRECESCIEGMIARAATYRGEFLENLIFSGSPEYEDWLRSQREKYLQQARLLFEKVTTCCERRGDYGRALVTAEKFLELSPWSDAGIRRVVRLAALEGRRGYALNQYQSFCRTLKNELGILPDIKTRQLVKNIQAGKDFPGNDLQEKAPHSNTIPEQNLERRQVTILCCQLVPDSEMDPEDEAFLLEITRNRCRELLSESCGYVARNSVPGIMLVYYGYPRAHENAPRMALEAANVLAQDSFPGISLALSVHTSVVLSAEWKDQPDTAGSASGQAITMSSLAQPGEIIVSECTRSLVDKYFEWRALGQTKLYGRGRYERCYKIEKARLIKDRLDNNERLSSLVGREEEESSLKHLWERVEKGGSCALLLQGDPGIGKSRLVRSFRGSLRKKDAMVIELRGYPETRQSPFKPLIDCLYDELGWKDTVNLDGRVQQLKSVMDEWLGERTDSALPLAADLLSLRDSASPGSNDRGVSRKQREKIIALLFELLEFLAVRKPVLLAVEDLHWIDPTTMETLARLFENGLPGSVLALMTARPEFAPSWPEDNVSLWTLPMLKDDDIRQIVTERNPEVSIELLERIVERADGIPLFAEELGRLSQESRNADHFSVPASLQDLLAARLDAVGKDKRLAQIAATVGREFNVELLKELSFMNETELTKALFRLKRAGLVSTCSVDRWQFCHALIRDSAYYSQTRQDRESAHERIARILAADFPQLTASCPELLAYHWSQAGVIEEAVCNWLKAGILAQSLCAHHEALKHFRAGLDLLPRLPDKAAAGHLEWQLQVAMGGAAYAIEGYASSQGARAYNRAVEIGERDISQIKGFPALWGLWAGASSHSCWSHSLRLAKRLVRIVQNGKDPVARQQGYFALGNVQFWRGEFEMSRKSLERAIGEYSSDQHNRMISDYGENAFVTSASYLSWSLCLLGFPQEAREYGQRALDEAKRLGHHFTLGYALTLHATLHRMLREPDKTLNLAEETIALAEQHDFPLWKAGATLLKGWARVVKGDLSGLGDMQWSVEQIPSLMSGISLIFLEIQADGLAQAGYFEESLAVIDKAFELMNRLDDHHAKAEFYRLRGICFMHQSKESRRGAQECFKQAMRISRRQNAGLLMQRAAKALDAYEKAAQEQLVLQTEKSQFVF